MRKNTAQYISLENMLFQLLKAWNQLHLLVLSCDASLLHVPLKLCKEDITLLMICFSSCSFKKRPRKSICQQNYPTSHKSAKQTHPYTSSNIITNSFLFLQFNFLFLILQSNRPHQNSNLR